MSSCWPGPPARAKSRLAARLGLPVVALDDFYRDGDDPLLPRITRGATQSLVDWDHPGSWDADRAVAALVTLCATGRADIPVYDIAHDGRVGHRELDLAGSAHVVAEGIFGDDDRARAAPPGPWSRPSASATPGR